jgi:hypothetical protein
MPLYGQSCQVAKDIESVITYCNPLNGLVEPLISGCLVASPSQSPSSWPLTAWRNLAQTCWSSLVCFCDHPAKLSAESGHICWVLICWLDTPLKVLVTQIQVDVCNVKDVIPTCTATWWSLGTSVVELIMFLPGNKKRFQTFLEISLLKRTIQWCEL